jgi:predicted metallopeptidase
MGIKYEQADDIKEKSEDIVRVLEWNYIDLQNVGFLRSQSTLSLLITVKSRDLFNEKI